MSMEWRTFRQGYANMVKNRLKGGLKRQNYELYLNIFIQCYFFTITYKENIQNQEV